MEYPLVSVVIPTCERKSLLKKTLFSLKSLDYPKGRMEVIVVDNGSEDGTDAMVRSNFPKTRLIKLAQNVGIPKALNLAIQKSKGAYIFQTNDDVIFDKGCLKELVNNVLVNKKIGIAGGRLFFSDRPKTPMISNLNLNLYLGYHSFQPTPSDKVSEVDIVTGACMLISKKLIGHVGAFDENFGPYGGEDYEFCFRAKRAGFKVLFCPKAKVWVKEFTGNESSERIRLFDHYKGKFLFMLLYGTLWQNLIFFPIQVLFAPIFCYIQSRKKVAVPIIKAIAWNTGRIKKTVESRRKMKNYDF